MQFSQITNRDIQALVDNELNWEEEKAVLSYIEDNPQARKYYMRLMEQKKLLKNWWREEVKQ